MNITVTKDIKYIGVYDREIDLFEGQYSVPEGISYNSYVIIDEKIAVMDTVDLRFGDEWLKNLENALDGRKPDYLVVHHMEPDHSANILSFTKAYPEAKIVASAKAFTMMNNFFNMDFSDRQIVVGEGDKLNLGKHELTFVSAPMVHWPEVVVSYDSCDKVLFSADGFGKFGTTDENGEWDGEARRYYIGIVGKYGAQVQSLLKKASALDIDIICPLHGPVLRGDLSHYIALYDTWSSYRAECDGVLIAYASIYGNTQKAALRLGEMLKEKGCKNVVLADLARCDMAEATAEAFRLSKTVFASSTYNADVFPFMREFINHLNERNFQSRTVAFIENGSWAPNSAKIMGVMLEKCKNLTYAQTQVKIMSALNEESIKQLNDLAEEICGEYK